MPLLRMLALSLLTLPSFATASEPGLPLFPQSTLERSERLEMKEYRIHTSAIREVRDEATSRDSLLMELEGKKRLISTDRDTSLEKVQDHYHAALEARQAKKLFRCAGRACGSSNVWANQVFGEPRLYGRDEEQSYQVAAWRDGNNRVQIVSLYIVQRGNRKIYVHEEAFMMPRGHTLPELGLSDQRVLGPVLVPWTHPGEPLLQLNEDILQEVLDLAAKHPAGRLYLLGFAPLNKGSMENLMARVDRATEKLAQRLEEEGIAAGRIHRKSLGPLVPLGGESASGRSGPRIEVMLIREKTDG